MLEKICSAARGEKHGLWHLTNPAISKPLEISASEFKRYVSVFTDIHVELGNILSRKNTLMLEYSQISTDFQGCMDRVYSFLGVGRISARPMLSKIAQISPDEEILNYQELKNHFQGTAYSKYFIY